MTDLAELDTMERTDFDGAFDAAADDAAPQEAPAQGKKGRPRTPARRIGGVDQKVARGVIERYLEIAEMGDEEIATIAALLDVDDSRTDVAVAMISGRKSDGVTGIIELEALMALFAETPMRAQMTIMGWEREVRNPVWGAMRVLGFVDGAIDPHRLNASEQVATAVASNLHRADRVRELAQLLGGK